MSFVANSFRAFRTHVICCVCLRKRCCNTLQHTTTHCNKLQYHNNIFQVERCYQLRIPLRHTQHMSSVACAWENAATRCNTPQSVAHGSVLRMTVCCSVLQCRAACCSATHVICCDLSCIWQCVACCSVLQCRAACCSATHVICCDIPCVWQFPLKVLHLQNPPNQKKLRFLGISRYKVKLRYWFNLNVYWGISVSGFGGFIGGVAIQWKVLSYALQAHAIDIVCCVCLRTCCITLQHTATRWYTLQHTATHCNTLQHTTKRHLIYMSSNTLQYTATHCNTVTKCHTATHCHTLHHTTSHYTPLQHAATHCNTLQLNATHCNALLNTAIQCTTLQYVATHCSKLQRTTMRCNTLQHAATYCDNASLISREPLGIFVGEYTATHCNTLQCAATHCKIMHNAEAIVVLCACLRTCRNILQHTAIYCNTLQYTATHCNILQHTAIYCNTLQYTVKHCHTLQNSATHCNTL